MGLKRLYRSKSKQVVGGVCAGLGTYLGLDPLLVRVLFAGLALLNGVGFLAYMLLWILVPEADTQYSSQEETVRQNVREIGQRLSDLARRASGTLADKGASPWRGQSKGHTLLVGLGILALGLRVLLNNSGALRWLRFGTLWPLLLIAVGIAMLLKTLRSRR